MNFWSKIDSIGVGDNSTAIERRYTGICNRVSIIFFALVFSLFLTSFSYFGWITSTKLALVAAFTFLIPLLLNYLGFQGVSRVILVSVVFFPTLLISIVDKLEHPATLETFEYFQYRIILLGGSVLPFIIFSLRERVNLLIGLFSALISLVFYDPIHNYFQVGYFQMGFSDANYYWMNYIFLFSFFVLVGSTYFLKRSFEKSEEENRLLIDQLSERQKEILKSAQAMSRQRQLLELENQNLNSALIRKNTQLLDTNKELIRHNNELQQFSYTISHNLKGPIASINGLLYLIDTGELGSSNMEVYGRLKESVTVLDGIVKDLGNIIDIRNDITRIRQKLVLEQEVKNIRTLLNKEIEEKQVEITTAFWDCPYLYSVRPMLHSILYNLVSNAIKYRSLERTPTIKLSSKLVEGNTILTVEDNGMGIDLKSFGDKVFGMYKRFHSHTDGKGLGLFLVKLQVEALGGRIEVESELGKGTRFILSFPEFGNIEEQVLLDNDVASIVYHAYLNCLGVYWKKTGTLDESITILAKSIDFIRNFRTPNWISDMSKVVDREEDDLNQFRRRARAELRNAGLRRVALIAPPSTSATFIADKDFNDVFDIDLRIFNSLKDAKEWLDAATLADSK